MDIQDKNRPEGRPEGQNESGKPRDGKRPGNRHGHHHRGGNRQGNRPLNPENTPAPQNQAEGETAPVRENERRGDRPSDRPNDRRNDRKGQGQPQQNRPQKGKSGDRKPEPRPAEQTADRPEGNESRRPAPATGRPQRNIRRAPAQADLPDMDNLLIEDAVTAEPPCAQPENAPDAAELERILEADIFARPETETIPDVIPEGKVVITGIRFRTGGKTYFFAPGSLTCTAGKYAIVETARGQEFGEICIGNRMVDESMVVPPLRPVIRIATEADIAHNEENREREEVAFRIGVEKIREHKLDMKLVSVQYTFDNAKLLFYFTSAGRVDFRELVKDLAGVFHIRIELRQIGIRDEARMIGGLGACGRPLCCTTFLSDFGQVSMKMAKEQNLSLNSSKISGCCGRLMCCLRYEYETYAEEIKRTPAQGTFVNTPDGPGMVTEIFPLQGEVKVSLRNQPDSPPKKYKRELVEVQVRSQRPEKNAAEEPEAEPDSET